MEKVTRQDAAAAVEEILITPRVLNAERYGRLIEELGALVRGAGEQSESLRRSAEDLRAAQVTAARTLEELRARSETITRSVAMIDQRLARGEALVARATEQVQRAQEAAARIEALSLPDATEVERRIAGAERAGLERIEAASRAGAETIEAMVRDGTARATACAIESARSQALEAADRTATERARAIAEVAASECAAAIIAGAESRVLTALAEEATAREAAIRAAIVEQATESTQAVEAAIEAAFRRGSDEAGQIATRGAAQIEHAEREARDRIDATIGSRVGELDSLLHRASGLERLGEPGMLDAAATLLKDLHEAIGRGSEALAALDGSAARVVDAGARSGTPAPTRSPTDNGAPMDSVRHGEARDSESKTEALAATRALDDRVRAATAHVEALVSWLGQVVGHAQQTGAALEMLLAQAGGRTNPGVGVPRASDPTGHTAGRA
jgi:hypothetical protein